MRNVSDKSCRESQNIHFMLNNFFQKIAPFMMQCGKICYSQTGRQAGGRAGGQAGTYDNIIQRMRIA
jgi:hypothetical protein